MPLLLQVLSRLSFPAQQMLLPKSARVTVPLSEQTCDINKAIQQEPGRTTWRDYYLNGSTSRHLSSAVDTKVLLQSNVPLPEQAMFSPSNVRQFSAPSIGVWHPDALIPRLVWMGGGFLHDARGGCFNPFAHLPDAVLVNTFTESLEHCLEPHEQNIMQWAMLQHGANSEPSRGNVPEARQDISCSWLPGKTELLSYGAMRAYPHQQVICIGSLL